ncbi:MAG: hypothetical protein IIB87_06320 [Chloroflexi bacterium]|nr:hypothetical protein [Chloroflexota bacterium]
MAGQPLRTPSGESAEQPWRSSLDALEAALAEAARAITELRFSLEEESTANSGPVAVPDDPAANEKSERLTDYERVWQRLERERKEPSAAGAEQGGLSKPSGPSEPSEPSAAGAEQDDTSKPNSSSEPSEPSAVGVEQDGLSKPSDPSEPSELRGLKLLPSNYLMTIEDRDASVDLITLQRGLLTLAPMEDIRLVTYAKGVPVISLRYEGELDLERLSEAIGNATGRRCEVIPQDGFKLYLRLTPNDDQEEEAT